MRSNEGDYAIKTLHMSEINVINPMHTSEINATEVTIKANPYDEALHSRAHNHSLMHKLICFVLQRCHGFN